MIIVEGMDNSGKTHLVKIIQDRFNLPTMHSPGPDGDIREFCLQTVKAEIGNTQWLYDRHSVISEQVYGPILRGRNTLPSRYVELVMATRPMIILCDPGFETIISNIDEREQMEGVAERARLLYDRYLLFLSYPRIFTTTLPWTISRYDWTASPLDKVLDLIELYLKGKEENPW